MTAYQPPQIIDDTTYTFGELVLIARKWRGVTRTTWYIICPDCKDKLLVNRQFPKQWKAVCQKCRYEYYITPAEYYILKPCDFSRIMGSL